MPRRPPNLIIVGQGSTALAVGVCWGRKGDVVTDVFFSLACHVSLLSSSLKEAARYRLKHVKGP